MTDALGGGAYCGRGRDRKSLTDLSGWSPLSLLHQDAGATELLF